MAPYSWMLNIRQIGFVLGTLYFYQLLNWFWSTLLGPVQLRSFLGPTDIPDLDHKQERFGECCGWDLCLCVCAHGCAHRHVVSCAEENWPFLSQSQAILRQWQERRREQGILISSTEPWRLLIYLQCSNQGSVWVWEIFSLGPYFSEFNRVQEVQVRYSGSWEQC